MTQPDSRSVCPLCGSDRSVLVSRIPVPPIITYWRQIGYDLEAAFPDLPEKLTKHHCPQCDARFFSPTLIGGADLYAALQRMEIYYGASKWEFTEVLRLLARMEPMETLLEFGCGRGRFLEQAIPHFGHVRGIDFNEGALAECQEKGLDVGCFDLSEINGSYDVIVSFQVLEHLSDPGKTFAQLAGLVRTRGLFIVAVPNEDGPLGEIQENYLNLPPHHFTRWSKHTMRFLARANDLQLERHICEPLSETLYLTLINERFARHLGEKGFVPRLFAAVARRIAIAGALAQFDAARERLIGHTQIAVYRKTAPAST